MQENAHNNQLQKILATYVSSIFESGYSKKLIILIS